MVSPTKQRSSSVSGHFLLLIQKRYWIALVDDTQEIHRSTR
jgi:hypothetical protein